MGTTSLLIYIGTYIAILFYQQIISFTIYVSIQIPLFHQENLEEDRSFLAHTIQGFL